MRLEDPKKERDEDDSASDSGCSDASENGFAFRGDSSAYTKPKTESVIDMDKLDRLFRENADAKAAAWIEKAKHITLKDFKVEPRLPDPTKERTKKAVDGYRATYATLAGNSFMQTYFKQWKIGPIFTCENKFTQDEASSLSYMWCYRMQYLCDEWKANGSCPFYIFTYQFVNSYQPPGMYRDWLANLSACSNVGSRLPDVTTVLPKGTAAP